MTAIGTAPSTATDRQVILIVDDDEGARVILDELLQPDYRVRVATSGARALTMATEEPCPDLILLDVMMPEMDGFDVLARLRAHPATRGIPVIFISELGAEADVEKGLELGADDYIAKPISPRILLARVRTQLTLKRAHDEIERQAARFEAEADRRGRLLRSITEVAQDAIIAIDADDVIHFWNPAAEKMFGYRAEEVIDRHLHPLLVPARYRAASGAGLAEFRRSFSGAALGQTLELAGLRKDGTEFPLELSLSAIRQDGAGWAVGLVRDISRRKKIEAEAQARLEELTALNTRLAQAQDQLLQSEKLASIGLLAAGVAHEINNPIGFVNSNLGTLNKYVNDLLAVISAYGRAEADLEEPTRAAFAEVDQTKANVDLPYLTSDIEQLVGESRDGLERVKRIIQALKDFSRIDSDETWKDEDIHQGLESTLNVVWNELKYHCEVRKQYGNLPHVECLLSHLNQVFMNLLVNAAQAIEGHGVITIRTGVRADEVWIEVADTGKGIPPENLPRIFDPFFTTKPVGKGTGLGLSVSYSIVQKHHGRLEVESEVGKGSVFRVWLPIHQPASGNCPA